MHPQLRALVIAGIGVIGGILLVVLVANAGSQDDSGLEVQLGDSEFSAGSAEQQAAEIAARGPITYADLAVRDDPRPIWVQHLAGDALRGWYAFDALAPGTTDCVVEYRPDSGDFVDCEGVDYLADGQREDGGGLTQYPVRIDDGELLINLNAELERPPGDNEVVD